jgi:hypothetical protein
MPAGRVSLCWSSRFHPSFTSHASGGGGRSILHALRRAPPPPHTTLLPLQRWYPAVATLSDARLLIVSGSLSSIGGYNSPPALNNPTYQIYDPDAETITNPSYLQLLVRSVSLCESTLCFPHVARDMLLIITLSIT